MSLHLRLLIFSVLLFTITHHSKALIPSMRSDALSLLSFKSSVSSDPLKLLSGWANQSSNSHCHWFGVTCDNPLSGRVISLKLTGFLAGKLSPLIGDLDKLQILSIPHNMFSGEIPKTIEKLQLLEVLELQGNNFSAKIPDQISYLHSLALLNLSNNALSGTVPSHLIGSGKLRIIDLSDNQLSGPTIVENASECNLLAHLKLSNNFLTQGIPAQIGKCRNLRTLLLDGNILEGRIPDEIGQISELRVLDVSRNSLTERIPRELSNCRKLSLLILTDLVDDLSIAEESQENSSRGEFNAFVGGIPPELLMLPSLQILWAPRANLGGRLPSGWTDSCSLRVLNLGNNYITGAVPESIGKCRNLSFLDLSSNKLVGFLPLQHLQVPCMAYFNVSRNSISGVLRGVKSETCDADNIPVGQDPKFLDREDFTVAFANIPIWGFQMKGLLRTDSGNTLVVRHDFSWNAFIGFLPPSFAVQYEIFASASNVSYKLLLNNNNFSGTVPYGLVFKCDNFRSVAVNLSTNQLSGWSSKASLLDCSQLMEFEAAENNLVGPIGPRLGDLTMLQNLDLSGNKLYGSLPDQLKMLKRLKRLLLGGNNLTGVIPDRFDQLTSLLVLDLSHNSLTGSFPTSLTNALNLQILLLDHNKLQGGLPSSSFRLSELKKFDVSFNNLSGHIPSFQHSIDCKSFKGNKYLYPCPDIYSSSPAYLPEPLTVNKQQREKKLKIFILATIASTSSIICVLLLIILVIAFGKKKLVRLTSLRRRVLVTFADAPSELTYENVVRATGNFSIRNLIGTGGFGSTYKAELSPGFLIAVKRLSIGRIQGLQQFEAEIRTLGRIRHKNLVTLIGYYMGEMEMFLIYNYLSGGNLETFIHEKSGESVQWSIILKIALDIAQAIAYLHYSCTPRIVHRDIKPSNILLDEDLNAYLSDFGLARLLEVSETHATTDVAGTFGYVAPEYAATCRVSDKADVYSFGVVLLELLSGRKSLDPSFCEYGNGFNIVPWAKLMVQEGHCSEFFLPSLWEERPKDNLLKFLRLALTCTVETLSVRPSMKQVVEKLRQLKS